MKQMLGHDGAPQGYWRENLLTGNPLTRCPRMVEREADGTAAALEVADARALLPHYRRGFLPEAGGVNDQPALTMKLLVMLDTTDEAAQAKAELMSIENARATGAEG